MNNLSEFPDEILEIIFKHIQLPFLFFLTRVCKQWRRIITSGKIVDFSELNKERPFEDKIDDNFLAALLRVISKQKVENIGFVFSPISDISIKPLISHFNGFKRIIFSFCNNITDDAIGTIVRNNRQLQEIYIANSNLTGVSITLIAEYCQNLRIIDSAGLYINDYTALYMARRCKHLEEIYFYDTELSDIAAIEFVKKCPNLCYGNFSRCPNMSDEGVYEMAQYCNSKLTARFVEGENISFEQPNGGESLFLGIQNGKISRHSDADYLE